MYIVPNGVPLNLTISTISSTSITVTWRDIDCLGRNGDIIAYDLIVVYYREVDRALIMQNISSLQTTYTIDRLLPLTEYRFQVAGVNINGYGIYTDFIGPIKTDEDGMSKFNDLFVWCYIA